VGVPPVRRDVDGQQGEDEGEAPPQSTGVPIDSGNPYSSRKGIPKSTMIMPRRGLRKGRGAGEKIRVLCCEGYRAEETPRAFLLGGRRVEVVRVLDRWRGEDREYVKLDGSDGARYILRYDRAKDEWEIQMMESPAAE